MTSPSPPAPPTLHDVARRAGVALSTASDILNGKLQAKPRTAQRVRHAAATLGYRPNALARRLRTARAEAIGLVVPFRRPIFSSALLADLLAGIQSEQQRVGLNLVLAAKRYEEPGEVYGADLFESRSVDGLIAVGTREAYDRNLGADVKALRTLGCPLVWLNYYRGAEPVDRVLHEPGPRQAWDQILEHLKTRGYTSAGILENGVGRRPGYRPRLADYTERLGAWGLRSRPEWMRAGEAWDGGAFREAMEILRAPERPAALLCEGDDVAQSALQAALGMGLRVPADVAIASTANYGLGLNAAVPLTTFGAPASEVGRRAVQRLVELIHNPLQEPREIGVPGGLVVRAST